MQLRMVVQSDGIVLRFGVTFSVPRWSVNGNREIHIRESCQRGVPGRRPASMNHYILPKPDDYL